MLPDSHRHSLWSVPFAALVTLVLGILFLPSTAVVAAGMTPADVARLERVSESAVSPDGEHIAYLREVPRRPFEDEDGPAWAQLFVVDRDGTSRPFISGEERLENISWTPDGASIAFLAKRGDEEYTGLYAIALAGGEARRLFEHGADIAEYSFSPDGKRVAFLAEEPGSPALEKEREEGFAQEIFEEDWQDTFVWVTDLGETAKEAQILASTGTASELHWSPTGDRLALTLQPTPAVDDRYTRRKVQILSLDGEVLARVDNPGKLGRVAWSPSGKHLAMLSAVDASDPSAGRLAVVDAGTGAMSYLQRDLEGDFVDFAWKDDSTLWAIVAQGAEHALWTISTEGKSEELIAGGKGCWEELSASADGKHVALRGDTAAHPHEVYAYSGGRLERLTHLNSWLEEIDLAPQEVITYKARDGQEIEGVLFHPLGREKGKRYPLVLDVHGGPEAHYCNGWITAYNRPGQTVAARGMAVLAANYRGSTGRGVAFAKLHQGDPAGKEFDDLVDGIDHLVAQGLVDKDRVGITGGSYGGFASAWGATYYSERYAAAVMFVGISDHISKAFTTDIANEMFLVHQRKRVWDDWQFFLERSPVYYARQAKTPLLILHGDSDTRVDPGQSLELYRALKLAGDTPVRHVIYPGEGHGNRKAGARLDYSLRMLRWLEHYLEPGSRMAAKPPWRLEYRAALGLEDEDDSSAEAED